jgi:hypothetical protein
LGEVREGVLRPFWVKTEPVQDTVLNCIHHHILAIHIVGEVGAHRKMLGDIEETLPEITRHNRQVFTSFLSGLVLSSVIDNFLIKDTIIYKVILSTLTGLGRHN